ncbi:MAG: isoleucine--tRNA ligase [Mycoplasmataceae bacterium]|nr:isoleucine--tRNA ligase [Mycoplasmataceae bacterium]
MEKKDYKDTLNMPETNFSMRANLNEKEKHFRQQWLDKKIYSNLLARNIKNDRFILHDGPPYANGSLHIGHSFNKILKDIIVRFKSAQGFYSPFVPGWDTHGLPIENKMLQEMNVSHKNLNVSDLRESAAKYALSQIEIQKNQFKEFQLLSDFNNYYITSDKEYEVAQLKIFKKLALDGLIYRGLKPVFWSTSSQSALAEAEVEYHDHRSPSIFVSFNITKGNKFVNEGDKLIIWTTTPWTLIANAGVAVNEKYEYVKVEVNDSFYIVANKLLESLVETFKWNNYKIISIFKGKDLIKTEYQLPLFLNQTAPVVSGHHVTLEAGTGLVHIAPLFGEDDFIIGKKNNLNMIMHIEDDGTINENGAKFSGIFYEDANKDIGMFLEENKSLLSLKFIKHSYPHDWRTNKPIIFRGTPQWFVSIEKVKAKILLELKDVKFYSEWGYKRISSMIENRNEWTISRQRSWGVPIIIFYDENKEVVINSEIFDYVIDLVSKYGSNIWYKKTTDELLPEKFRNKNWTKENDIMDVWFDSGSSFAATNIFGEKPPFDLYFEGSDQYRGWFNSSLINSVAYIGKAPFKALLSHGFVLDAKGNKMSKSKGNVVDPQKIISLYGADVLRLWAANSEYSNDVTIGDNIIKQNVEIYRKIRNTFRFLLANLNDYEFEEIVKTDIHALIDERVENLKIKIGSHYEVFNFINIIKDINNFITDLSSFYLSIIKDVLYAENKDNIERLMIQNNLYKILEFLLISLAPIIPTTTDEAYEFFNKKNKLDSVHLENFYKYSLKESFVLENVWKEFFETKDLIYKEIEIKIKNGDLKRTNEASVTMKLNSQFLKNLDFRKLLMIGQFKEGESLLVSAFDSIKCQRCWNHFSIKDMKNELCDRCHYVLKK